MAWHKCITGNSSEGGGWKNYIPISSSTTSSILNDEGRFAGGNSYDGSLITAWMPKIFATEENITYNLGALRQIRGIALSVATGAQSNVVATINVYTSTDGVNYTILTSIEDGTFSNPWNNQSLSKRQFLSNVSATHIKIGVIRKSGQAGVSVGVGEIEIYGE